MANPLRILKRTVGNLELYRRFHERQELSSYRFQTDPLTPSTSLGLVDYGSRTHHKIFINARVPFVQKQVSLIKQLRYSKPNRSISALIQGCVALGKVEALIRKSELNLLCIGYGTDTYDAQLLSHNNLAVSLVSLDVANFAPHRTWSSFSSREDAVYIQGDARKLADLFPEKRFDIILMCRGSVDLMPLADLATVWEQAVQILADPGCIIGSVKGLELTPTKVGLLTKLKEHGESAIQSDRPTYKTAIGEFRLGGNFAPWYLPNEESFPGTDVLSMLSDDVSQVSSAKSLVALNGESAQELAGTRILETVAASYDRYHERLNILKLPCSPQVASVDWIMSRTEGGTLSMRSTLVATKGTEGSTA